MPEQWEIEINAIKTRILDLESSLEGIKKNSPGSLKSEIQKELSTLRQELSELTKAPKSKRDPEPEPVIDHPGKEDTSNAGFWAE